MQIGSDCADGTTLSAVSVHRAVNDSRAVERTGTLVFRGEECPAVNMEAAGSRNLGNLSAKF